MPADHGKVNSSIKSSYINLFAMVLGFGKRSCPLSITILIH